MSDRKIQLILASQSTARRRLLKRLGLKFICRPANVDEDAAKRREPNPKRLTLELARLKAAVVADRYPNAVIIGGDQVLVCAGRIFGKPGTEAGAVRQLQEMSGKTVRLMTAVCVLDRGREVKAFVHQTSLKVRKLGRQEIREYVRADQPFDCAGSFKFEEQGITLFESVGTDDPTAIEGLPLLHLAKVLRKIVSYSSNES